MSDAWIIFQSTLPARGATTADDPRQHKHKNFNPRSPRGERRFSFKQGLFDFDFNPRSPRGERPDNLFLLPRLSLFQSTLPARGATLAGKPFAYYELISIHAPREGSDLLREGRTNKERNFNPRSPRGERPTHITLIHPRCLFQSTLPARGAT